VTLAVEEQAVGERSAPGSPGPGSALSVRRLDGAEIGGAVKNVLAIACGVVEGAGSGSTPAPR
jgi:glycerol-3-phosphate dehydrogenase (NAD(P)+)